MEKLDIEHRTKVVHGIRKIQEKLTPGLTLNASANFVRSTKAVL